MVNFFLELDFIDINTKNHEEKSFLTIALENKKFEIANIISDYPINIQEKDLDLASEVNFF